MKQFAIVTIFVSAIVLTGYFFLKGNLIKNPSPTVIIDSSVLRMEIVKSIKRPFDFDSSDTLVLTTGSFYCGNMTKEEKANLPISFDTKLEEGSFRQQLSRNLKVYILTSKYFFDSASNRMEKAELYEGCEKNKVYAIISAEISKEDGHVYVHENYMKDSIRKTIDKEFFMDTKGNWQYQ